METNKLKQRRRFALVLPVLVLPFVAFMFWVLGGGQHVEDSAEKQQGFNPQLPTSSDVREKTDKLSAYGQALEDSTRREQMAQLDPAIEYGQYNGYQDPQAEQIYSGLAQINSDLGGDGYSSGSASRGPQATELDRLEHLMRSIGAPEKDPQLEQLDGMLEKIAAIQNPELANEKLRQLSREKRGQVYPVTRLVGDAGASVLEATEDGENGFLSVAEQEHPTVRNAIRAVVHQRQVVVNGANVKLRLAEDIYVNGTRIPKDSFITGKAALSDERLSITIESIVYNNSIFPVELSVYDLDGIDGIHIPGAIGRDVVKQSADRSLQGIGLGLDPSWGAQAANAGIEVAKSFIGRKTKLVKVIVKAGYRVLLLDEQQKR